MPKNLRPYWNRLKKTPPGPEYDKNLRKMRQAMQQQLPLPADIANEILNHLLVNPLSRDSLYKVEETIDIMLGEPADNGNSTLSERDINFIIELIDSRAMHMDMKVVTAFMQTALYRGYL